MLYLSIYETYEISALHNVHTVAQIQIECVPKVPRKFNFKVVRSCVMNLCHLLLCFSFASWLFSHWFQFPYCVYFIMFNGKIFYGLRKRPIFIEWWLNLSETYYFNLIVDLVSAGIALSSFLVHVIAKLICLSFLIITILTKYVA